MTFEEKLEDIVSKHLGGADNFKHRFNKHKVYENLNMVNEINAKFCADIKYYELREKETFNDVVKYVSQSVRHDMPWAEKEAPREA